MARSRRRYQTPVPFQRSVQSRLMMSVGMLVVLALLIQTARDPAQWRWLAPEEARGDVAEAAAKIAALPDVVRGEYPLEKGPTDADPAEWQNAEEDFAVVQNKTESDGARENFALQRLIHWVRRQTPEQLAARVRPEVRLNELLEQPPLYTGKLVRFRLNIKQAIPIAFDPKNPDPALRTLYRLSGFAEGTGLHIYIVQTPSLPTGFPTGEAFESQRVVVDGYFYKIRRYRDQAERPWYAPIIIGAVTWYPGKAVVDRGKPEYFVVTLAIGIGVALLVLLLRVLGVTGRVPVIEPLNSPSANVDGWLTDPPPYNPLDESLHSDGSHPHANGHARGIDEHSGGEH